MQYKDTKISIYFTLIFLIIPISKPTTIDRSFSGQINIQSAISDTSLLFPSQASSTIQHRKLNQIHPSPDDHHAISVAVVIFAQWILRPISQLSVLCHYFTIVCARGVATTKNASSSQKGPQNSGTHQPKPKESSCCNDAVEHIMWGVIDSTFSIEFRRQEFDSFYTSGKKKEPKAWWWLNQSQLDRNGTLQLFLLLEKR